MMTDSTTGAQPPPVGTLSLSVTSSGPVELEVDRGALTFCEVELSSQTVDKDDKEHGQRIGMAEFWILEFSRCRADGISLLEALDAESADTEMFCPLVDHRGWSAELVDFLGRAPGPDLVIADRTTIEPMWRNHGLSLLLASVALRAVGRGRGLASMVPSPNELVAVNAPDGEVASEKVRLRQLWARLGYVEFRNDIHLLPLSSASLDRRAVEFVRRYEARSPALDPDA